MYYTNIDFHSSDYSMYVVFLVLRGLLTSFYSLCKASRAVTEGTLGSQKVIRKRNKNCIKKIIFFSFSFLNEIVWDKSMIIV